MKEIQVDKLESWETLDTITVMHVCTCICRYVVLVIDEMKIY